MPTQIKSFTLKLDEAGIKKLDEGVLTCCFATMGVWDKDGDWAEPGFYGNQDVVMLPAHDWSHVPLGKGTTREEGDMACADIKMNLDIQAAKDWHSAIKFDLKNGKPLQEYSYGFKILDGGAMEGERLGRRGRILRPREDRTPGSKIWEISPVLVGAGERTRTLAAKAAGMKFCDEVQAVLDAADSLVSRGKSLADLRAKEGRELSAANREKLAALAEALVKSAAGMTDLVQTGPCPEAQREYLRYLKQAAGK